MIFAPTVEEMYPSDATTTVLVNEIGDRLDGASRPGHFHGVGTVVSKLFHIAVPHKAYFGQKDAAQVAVLRKMVRDLNFPLQVVVCPIVREADGLAMSSRNRYLSAKERKQALVLSRALNKVKESAAAGETSSQKLIDAARSIFDEEPDVRIDYLSIVNPDTLEDIPNTNNGALVAVAAFIGKTRLIDNLLL
jgi:pantoate--beta-alanine ligase